MDYKKTISELSEQVYFPRVFIHLTGSHSAAYFLSQCVYWEGKMGGEFYRTQEQWTEDGYREDSLRTAIKKCSRYVEVVKKGIPAKNHYSVNWKNLSEDIIKSATSDPETPVTSHGDSPPLSIQDITQESATVTRNVSESELDDLGTPEKKGRTGPPSRAMAEFLCREAELQHLDGGRSDYAHANKIKEKIADHIQANGDKVTVGAVFEAYKKLVRAGLGDGFHAQNMTSLGYVDRNFNKLLNLL